MADGAVVAVVDAARMVVDGVDRVVVDRVVAGPAVVELDPGLATGTTDVGPAADTPERTGPDGGTAATGTVDGTGSVDRLAGATRPPAATGSGGDGPATDRGGTAEIGAVDTSVGPVDTPVGVAIAGIRRGGGAVGRRGGPTGGGDRRRRASDQLTARRSGGAGHHMAQAESQAQRQRCQRHPREDLFPPHGVPP